MALTKDDIYALKHANTICVYLGSHWGDDGLVRVIKRKPYNPKPFEEDKEHILTEKVMVESMRGKQALVSGLRFFASADMYRDSGCYLTSIINTLRVGDELIFSFYPDANTNQYVARAGLHADVLMLYVWRKGKRVATWKIASSICPDNSARMCQGVPHDSYLAREVSA